MQISSVNLESARYTTDRPLAQPSEPTADRTRQDNVRLLAQAVRIANQSGQIRTDAELTIALDRDSGQPVIRLIDRETRELIQQIPKERVLRMAEEYKRASAQQASPGGHDWLSTLA